MHLDVVLGAGHHQKTVSSHRIYLEKRGKQNNRHKVNKSIDQKIVGETAGAGNDCNFK